MSLMYTDRLESNWQKRNADLGLNRGDTASNDEKLPTASPSNTKLANDPRNKKYEYMNTDFYKNWDYHMKQPGTDFNDFVEMVSPHITNLRKGFDKKWITQDDAEKALNEIVNSGTQMIQMRAENPDKLKRFFNPSIAEEEEEEESLPPTSQRDTPSETDPNYILDRINNLKNKGFSRDDIINAVDNSGLLVQPNFRRDINSALDKAYSPTNYDGLGFTDYTNPRHEHDERMKRRRLDMEYGAGGRDPAMTPYQEETWAGQDQQQRDDLKQDFVERGLGGDKSDSKPSKNIIRNKGYTNPNYLRPLNEYELSGTRNPIGKNPPRGEPRKSRKERIKERGPRKGRVPMAMFTSDDARREAGYHPTFMTRKPDGSKYWEPNYIYDDWNDFYERKILGTKENLEEGIDSAKSAYDTVTGYVGDFVTEESESFLDKYRKEGLYGLLFNPEIPEAEVFTEGWKRFSKWGSEFITDPNTQRVLFGEQAGKEQAFELETEHEEHVRSSMKTSDDAKREIPHQPAKSPYKTSDEAKRQIPHQPATSEEFSKEKAAMSIPLHDLAKDPVDLISEEEEQEAYIKQQRAERDAIEDAQTAEDNKNKEAGKGVPEVVSIEEQVQQLLQQQVDNQKAEEEERQKKGLVDTGATFDMERNFWYDKPLLKAAGVMLFSSLSYGADLGKAFMNASAIYDDQVGIDRRTEQAQNKLDQGHSYGAVEHWVRKGDSDILIQDLQKQRDQKNEYLERYNKALDAIKKQFDLEKEQETRRIMAGIPDEKRRDAMIAELDKKIIEAKDALYDSNVKHTITPAKWAKANYDKLLAEAEKLRLITEKERAELNEKFALDIDKINKAFLIGYDADEDEVTKRENKTLGEYAKASREVLEAMRHYNNTHLRHLIDPDGQIDPREHSFYGPGAAFYSRFTEASLGRWVMDTAEALRTGTDPSEINLDELLEKTGADRTTGQAFTNALAVISPFLSKNADQDEVMRLFNRYIIEQNESPQSALRKSVRLATAQRILNTSARFLAQTGMDFGNAKRVVESAVDQFASGIKGLQLDNNGTPIFKVDKETADMLNLNQGEYYSMDAVGYHVSRQVQDLQLALDKNGMVAWFTDPVFRKENHKAVMDTVKKKRPAYIKALKQLDKQHKHDLNKSLEYSKKITG